MQMLTFIEFLEEGFQARVTPEVANTRKLLKLNDKMNSSDPYIRHAAGYEKQQYLRDRMAKKQAAQNRMVGRRGKN